jgi:hypothetical protein
MLNAVLLSQSPVGSLQLRTATARPYASARRDKRSTFKLFTRALVLAAGSFLLVASLVEPPAAADSRPHMAALDHSNVGQLEGCGSASRQPSPTWPDGLTTCLIDEA